MKDKIIEKMYEISKKPYQKWIKKNKSWSVTISELLLMEEQTLGFHLGNFLNNNHFEMQEKLENHDVFHVLTKTGVSVQDEIAMQFYLLGNGKRSLYLYLVIYSGILLYPFCISTFYNAYQKGKNAQTFFDLPFEKMLLLPIQNIRETFNIQ